MNFQGFSGNLLGKNITIFLVGGAFNEKFNFIYSLPFDTEFYFSSD
jgi:hypothetical protein